MSFTRERWCFVGGWLSRLDMNTFQTRIKTDTLLTYLHPVHYRTNLREEIRADKRASQVRIIRRHYGNYHSILLVSTAYTPISTHFGIEFVQLPHFINSDDSENGTHGGLLSSLLNIVQTSNGLCSSTEKSISSQLGRYPCRDGYLRYFIFAHRFKKFRRFSYSNDHVRIVVLVRV